MSDTFIQNRLHLHFPGYEPLTAHDHYERYARELKRFDKLWGAQSRLSDLEDEAGVSTCSVDVDGGDWQSSTKLTFLEWSSGVDRPILAGFWKGVIACLPRYLAHYKTNAPWRYFSANWRYGMYFVYPVLIVILFLLVASVIVAAVNWVFPLPNLWVMLGLVVLICLGLIRLFGERMSVPLVMDVMHYTHSLANKDDPVSLARLETFSSYLLSEVSQTDADDILVTFHSTGSVFAAASLAEALRRNPKLLDDKTIVMMGVGSNLLKLGLMKECEWLRDDLALVLAHDNVQWIEMYANDDILCFGRTGPQVAITSTPANPVRSHRVRFSKMIAPDRYKRIRGKFFRIHRQMVFANEKPYFYDFFLLSCGPRRTQDCLDRTNTDAA